MLSFYNLYLEVEESELRRQLWQHFLDTVKKYGVEMHPKFVAHQEKAFQTLPLEEIQPDKIEQQVKSWKSDQDHQKQKELKQQQKDDRALRTSSSRYYVCDSVMERAVCSDGSPGFEKTGMPAFSDEIVAHDKKLAGYYAIHVGDAHGWLPILKRDGYCDAKYAYIYSINCEAVAETDDPFYETEDFHIMDATHTPHSVVIFSKRKVIPANLIHLEEKILLSKIKTAPDPY